jgi:hypothetical protein
MAADGQRLYAAVADAGRSRQTNPLDTRRFVLDPRQGGGVTALRIVDGSHDWHFSPTPCPANAPSGCSPSQPGAVTAIPGVVFATPAEWCVNSGYPRNGGIPGNVLLAFKAE